MRLKKDLLINISASAATALVVAVAVIGLQPILRPQIRAWLGYGLAPQAPTAEIKIPEQRPGASEGPVYEDLTVKVVKSAQPAVVSISISAEVAQRRQASFFDWDPFEEFFGSPQETLRPEPATPSEPVQVGGGSGFFVSSDGLVATNKHVVQAGDLGENPEFKVMTMDGKSYPAKVLAVDPILDLAFLKVEGQNFPFLRLGDSDKLEPGQTVIAIGNALDEFRNTVTRGVVSGLNRRIVAGNGSGSEVIEEAIQTDAAINPGNSGGPLLDMQGKVVGINTAVSLRGQLLGFAIPASSIKRDLDSVQKSGKITRPFLGVRYILVTPELIKANQLKVDHGALIMRGSGRNDLAVAPGSPADKAGLKENDIILEVDGVPINEEHSLASQIGKHVTDDEIVLKIYQAGEEKTVTVKLEEMKTE
jgi:serine protease Do